MKTRLVSRDLARSSSRCCTGAPKTLMDEPIRLVQTNLRETDDALDPVRIVKQLEDFPANALLFGMGGIVAHYPTKVAFLYASRYIPAGHRARVTRLIARWMKTRQVRRQPARRPQFSRRYTVEDIVLMAEVDGAHQDLSGPAVRHILKREFQVFGKTEYIRLAGISVSHIYNLRRSYRRCRVSIRPTQGRRESIAERRKPDPKGDPVTCVSTRFTRDHDGKAGVYHITSTPSTR